MVLVTNLSLGWPRQPALDSAKIITPMASMCQTCSGRKAILCHTPGKFHQIQLNCVTDSDRFAYFRMRINKEFEDGESCTVTLKDRFKPQDEEAKEWYDRAFGAKRNIMKIELSFVPPPADVTPGSVKFSAKLNYAMFPEMQEGEFAGEEAKYNAIPNAELANAGEEALCFRNEFIELESYTDDNGVVDYHLEVDVPYGSYSPQIYLQELNSKDTGDGSAEP